MTTPLAQHTKKQEPSAQVANEEVFKFKEEKHQEIYDTFLKWLEQYREWDKLPPDEEENFSFILEHSKAIFSSMDQEKIKPLSGENFCELLLSVYKKIREENLADEKSLNNGKIQKVVDGCVDDIRATEAKDWVIDGIKSQIPGKELLKKIPGLGKFLGDEEEKKEKPLSDEQMATQFLRKSLLPIAVLTITLLLGGLSGPISVFGLFTIPHVIVIGFAVLGFATAEYKAVKSLFSNDKEGTLYNTDTKHEKKIDWYDKILNGINNILETSVKGVEKSEQSTVTAEEQLTQAEKKANPPTELKEATVKPVQENGKRTFEPMAST